MPLDAKQVTQLLKPINPSRVLKDPRGNSHVSQQDVTAHLIRVFGFGGFDVAVLDSACVFETERRNDKGEPNNRWDVCYRAMVRLTVRDPDGGVIGVYENGSTHTSQNQNRGDAHDQAYKSSISLSVKRAAINLGDQFGLSLYNKGQMSPLVKATMVLPDPPIDADPKAPHVDVQEGVEEQVSLGNDEVDHEPPPEEVRALPSNLPYALEHAEETLDIELLHEWRKTATALGAKAAVKSISEVGKRVQDILNERLRQSTAGADA